MGRTQYKRRQMQRHQKSLRTCGECPITLLCYTGRLPAYTTICRCNTCCLIYALDATTNSKRLRLFKPFRCTQPMTRIRDDRQIQLLSGLTVLSMPACMSCKSKRLCTKCGKPCKPYDQQLSGEYIHFLCTDVYQRAIRQELLAKIGLKKK